jgi:hypothetical protein
MMKSLLAGLAWILCATALFAGEYTSAEVKKIQGNKVTLSADGKEVVVYIVRDTQGTDAEGKQVKGQSVFRNVVRRGNTVNVTTKTMDGRKLGLGLKPGDVEVVTDVKVTPKS